LQKRTFKSRHLFFQGISAGNVKDMRENRRMKKILIIKLCCVGDILFTTPAIRALRKGFSKAYLAYLVGSWSKEIIEDNPNLDEVIIYDPPAHSFSRWRAFISTLSCLRKLRQKRFDLAVIFHRTSFGGLFSLLGGIPQRIGFDYAGQGRLLTQKVVFDTSKHEVDRYLDVVASLGLAPAGQSTEMKVMPKEENCASNLLRANGVKTEDRLIGILAGGGENPGTSMPTKRWQPAKFARLADTIIEECDAKVIFVGGPGDEEVVKKVVSGMKNEPINLVGKTTFKQLAAVLKHCLLFIGGDSGPLHIAAAVGTPTIGIFGPSDPGLVAPRGENHLVVWKNVPCSPCYWPDTVLTGHDFSSCLKGTLECMEKITVEDVLAAVRQQMKEIDL
jgi:heptosyltransferase-2